MKANRFEKAIYETTFIGLVQTMSFRRGYDSFLEFIGLFRSSLFYLNI